MSLSGFTEFTPKLSILLVTILLSLPLSLVNGYSTFLDSPVRTTLNGSFIESYSFWWTNLTYLPSFFFLFLVSIFVVLSLQLGVRHLHWYLLLLLYVYLLEVSDYTPLNVTDLTTSYSNYGLNRLLTNTLNKYHPFIFYFSVCVLLSSLYIYNIEVIRCDNAFTPLLALAYWERLSWLVVLVNLPELA